jgi:aspartyl aminopeptidase
MAHALHPNYPDRSEPRHAPRLNGGPVIKHNANARYATDAVSGAFFAKICREAKVPFQRYVNRADMVCGSTLGPIVSTQLGLRTVDVGSPMLAMHSSREMAGALDPGFMVRAMRRFYLS